MITSENEIGHLVVVTGSYPSTLDTVNGRFVQVFAHAIARQGIKVTVVNPISIIARRPSSIPCDEVEHESGHAIQVVRPLFLSAGVRPLLGCRTAPLTQWGFQQAVWRALRHMHPPTTHIYGHFLYPAGAATVWAARRLGCRSFVGVGEGTFWTVEPLGFERARRDFAGATGFVAVATHIQKGLVRELGVPPGRIIVAPNGVDLSRFQPFDRDVARHRLGLPVEGFLVVFVGTFDDLKGGLELVKAVEDLDGVQLALLGQGPQQLASARAVYKGVVPHSEIPTWLSAGDVFVLPTREEGSCNAVIEALACGLPVVTSVGDYMDDIVDDQVAIRVDPTDVAAIRGAIIALKADPARRRSMARNCLRKAQDFDIDQRARRILDWMISPADVNGVPGVQ